MEPMHFDTYEGLIWPSNQAIGLATLWDKSLIKTCLNQLSNYEFLRRLAHILDFFILIGWYELIIT